ncbi:hypothetical protein [Paenibacillus xylanexedens]|uniref:Uncharacterized protein n=1 Tax=Paenibacillus xylanexedens TaxID=528191 RepID=A0ABS4RR17_PAEXY|nr:hypothetical protein [Paenibacillus xylanexedens]MBP2245333.1 hypothetical protein [Paenibacillus xylanexedens]
MTKKHYLLNVTGFFSQMVERMKADCRPNIANHAKKQYEKYNRQLEALKELG